MNLVQKDTVLHLLKESGLKATPQRIYTLLTLKNSTDHPTAEKLFQELRELVPGISLATIYKTLDTLIEHHLASKVNTVDGSNRFDANMEHHFHLYDEETGTLTDFSNSSLYEALKSFIDSEKVENFELSSFSLQINGRKMDSTKPVNINSK